MKEKKQLMSSIHELEGKINFLKNYDIKELSPEHREKAINAIRICNMVIDLILDNRPKHQP